MKPTALRAVGATAVAAAAVAAFAGAAPASAKPAPLVVAYDASGSTMLKKPNTTVDLPATTLTTNLAPSGAFTGSLPLAPTSASFNALGFVPTSATVNFIPVGKIKGKLVTQGTVSTVTATAQYIIKLTDVKVAGIDAAAGNSCQTTAPVTIPISTPPGGRFDITTGGTVTGTYTVGDFANCGITTGILNLLVPGPDNTVTFTLSNGRILGQ